MAGKEFNIPVGPDRTGGMEAIDVAAIAPEGSDAAISAASFADADATSAMAAIPALADLPQVDLSQGNTQGIAPMPTGDATARGRGTQSYVNPALFDDPVDIAASTAPVQTEQVAARPRVAQPASEVDVLPEEAPAADGQGMDDVQRSFAALRDSIGQGRELKAREKEREELAEALDADHEELADRENILANYHTMVAEQDQIIAMHNEQREARKVELANVVNSLEQTQYDLESLRNQNDLRLEPLETELGRVRASADQAKNDERSRKQELNAAESELRRAEGDAMATAQRDQVQAAYEEARHRSEQAKEQLAQAQKSYDDAKQQAEQQEAPLERSIADLKRQSDQLKEEIDQLGDEISVARKRRQYCDNVYQYPEETARMREEVASAEEAARQMDAENDLLREQLEESKQRAKKAKVAIGVVIAIVVVFIIALIVVAVR